MKSLIGAIAFGGMVALLAAPAQASFVVTYAQDGANVVATGAGSLNLQGLTPDPTSGLTAGVGPGVSPSDVFVSLGPIVGIQNTVPLGAPLDIYIAPGLLTGPDSFGPGPGAVATSGTGDSILLYPIDTSIGVPMGYVSGGQLSDSATYANTTIAALGLTQGLTTFDLGNGDTFSIDVLGTVAAVPEPSTWVMMILGFCGLGFMAYCRKQNGSTLNVA